MKPSAQQAVEDWSKLVGELSEALAKERRRVEELEKQLAHAKECLSEKHCINIERAEKAEAQLTLCRVALERIANDYEPVTKDGLLWPNIDPREVAKEALNSLTSKTQGESDAT